MIAALAQSVVVLAAAYLLALGVVALASPARAGRFLLGFAGSPGKHYTELALRLVVGAALLVHAPWMLQPRAFALGGWILVITTAGLLIVPWRWHQRFAREAVPRALRHLPWVGAASLLLGGLMVAAVVLGAEPGAAG